MKPPISSRNHKTYKHTLGGFTYMKTMFCCTLRWQNALSYLSDVKQLTNNFTELAKCSRQPRMIIGNINKLKRNLYTLRGLERRSLGSTSVAGGHCNQLAPLSGQVASLLWDNQRRYLETSPATLDDQTRKFDFWLLMTTKRSRNDPKLYQRLKHIKIHYFKIQWLNENLS
jgi:hypothetical protein